MVAFKEEFPYLRCESGQLFEFNQQWLRAAITRAADQAGYPSWWLTDHITESIAFYLRLRNDEPVVPFSQLSQTVRYVLKVIGYKEIIPYFSPTPPPISLSLVEIAEAAGAGYELAFFDGLEKRISALVETGHRQFAARRSAGVRETSPWREDVDPRLRHIARRSCLLRARETGGGPSRSHPLLHSLGAEAHWPT